MADDKKNTPVVTTQTNNDIFKPLPMSSEIRGSQPQSVMQSVKMKPLTEGVHMRTETFTENKKVFVPHNSVRLNDSGENTKKNDGE